MCSLFGFLEVYGGKAKQIRLICGKERKFLKSTGCLLLCPDKILEEHSAYENDARLGNLWYRGKYKPGIREFGYPIRLPSEQWTNLIRMRGGLDERNPNEGKVYNDA